MRYLWFGMVLCLMQSLGAQEINSDTTMVINGETYTYAQIQKDIMNDGNLIDLMTEDQMMQIDAYLAQILAQENAKQQAEKAKQRQLDQSIAQTEQSIAQSKKRSHVLMSLTIIGDVLNGNEMKYSSQEISQVFLAIADDLSNGLSAKEREIYREIGRNGGQVPYVSDDVKSAFAKFAESAKDSQIKDIMSPDQQALLTSLAKNIITLANM